MRTFSEDAAKTWVKRIRQAVKDARASPRRYRVVPEMNEESIRELFVGRYRVWYRIRDAESTLEVIVVFHGARQVPD